MDFKQYQKYERFIELNVQEQCLNIIKTAVVQEVNRLRTLPVQGWVFDVPTERLKDLCIDSPDILADIMKINRLA